MSIGEIKKWARANPRKVILIDAFGALLSAFILGVLGLRFQSLFGIPQSALYILAALPCLFFLFDLFCYLKRERRYIRLGLRVIGIANLTYCCLSVIMLIYHWESLTANAFVYMTLELFIVSVLALLELEISKSVN